MNFDMAGDNYLLPWLGNFVSRHHFQILKSCTCELNPGYYHLAIYRMHRAIIATPL